MIRGPALAVKGMLPRVETWREEAEIKTQLSRPKSTNLTYFTTGAWGRYRLRIGHQQILMNESKEVLGDERNGGDA